MAVLRRPICALAQLALVLVATTCEAATINVVTTEESWYSYDTSQEPKCNLRLEGDIVDGDFGRLVKAQDKLNVYPGTLCLNSPGGSYFEALKIARHLIREKLSITVVEDQAQCLSACALIFMAGGNRGSDFRKPRRILHVGSKLGFHAPYFSASQIKVDTFTKDDFLAAYKRGLQDSREMLNVFDQVAYDRYTAVKEKWMRASLINLLMTRAPGEFFFIDTVGKAGNWRIDIYGHMPPSDFGRDSFATVCKNHYLWRSDSYDGAAHERLGIANVKVDREGTKIKAATDILDGGSGGPTCHVEIDRSNKDFPFKGMIKDPVELGGGVVLQIEPWHFYAQAARLSDIRHRGGR